MTAGRDYMAEHRDAQAHIDAMATELLTTLEASLYLLDQGKEDQARTLIAQVIKKARGRVIAKATS